MSTVVKDLGPVTAYADAVAAGYTGTKEEWQALMASYASVAEEAQEAREGAEAAQDAAEDARDAAISAKTGAESAVSGFGTVVTQATNQAVQTVQAEGTTQVGNVSSEGTTQVNAVQAKGAEVLESIPEDYTELSNDVSQLKEDLTDSAFYIIDGKLNWLENTVIDLANGKPKTTSGYFASNVFVCSNFSDISRFPIFKRTDGVNYISFYLDGNYVGYFFRNKFYNPSSTEVSSITFDSCALTVQSTSYKNITKRNNASDRIASEIHSGFVFDWANGYYNLQAGYWNGYSDANGYWSSQVISGEYVPDEITKSNIFLNNTAYNSLFFWLGGVYAGYYLNGQYHAPSGTVVDSIIFDSYAVGIYGGNHEQLNTKGIYQQIDEIRRGASSGDRFSWLKSLKIGFLGDSITNGVGASDSSKSYVGLMSADFDTVINYGINGCLIANESGYSNAMVNRYSDMSDDLDVVVVYGGTNDWYYGTAWGTTDSTDTSTFLGALNVLMSGLVNKYCGKEIFFVTPMSSAYSSKNTDNANACGKTMLDYRNAIIERATYHAIPVIDLYGMCNMDVAHNTANKTYYSSDGVHPNDAGHKRVHDRILTFIGNILI